MTAWVLATLMLLGVVITSINPLPGGPAPDKQPQFNATQAPIRMQAAADAVPDGIRGIDISKWQGTINWERVAQDDVNFVLARASVGQEIDETFVRNAQGAHENGILVGAYHYARFTNQRTALAEARVFIEQLNMVEITYPVALDIEVHRNIKRDELTRLSILFMEEVEKAGYDVMLYTYHSFLLDYLNRDALGNYKLWIANYIAEPHFGQSVWQYTSRGRVRGINGNVDINVAYEDLSKAGAVRKIIKVSGPVSRNIKQTLNERYGAGIKMEGLDMTEIDRAVATALQKEVNKQFGINLPIHDRMTESALSRLQSINYVKGRTKGNITYLIQVSLFYKGLYTGYPTGEYDDATAESVRAFQSQSGIRANGQLNPETIKKLLG